MGYQAEAASPQTPPNRARWEVDEMIHQPVRLSIMSVLANSQKVDFSFLRKYLELTDSNLSRHLTALESAGYIVINKVFEGKKPRTWLSLSQEGETAFKNYVTALQNIVSQSPTSEGSGSHGD